MSDKDAERDRSSRVQEIVDDCIARRLVGEEVTDEQIVEEHVEMMPELGQALRSLELVERAERLASDSSRGAGRLDRPALSVGSFPGYEIVGEIHRGGQGVVYQAIQGLTQRSVAIKVVQNNPSGGADTVVRFEREVQILGRLNHPNILTIHDTGSTADTFYYVMDYISGDPLDESIAARPRSVRETLQLFIKVCDAVGAAHLLGVIHRDLKPGNVLVDDAGEPHVLDFGLAKVIDSEVVQRAMTTTGQFVGSLPWASPEQIAGSPHDIDVRTDVYSLGVMLYHALTARFPYQVTGAVREVIDNILTTEPARPGALVREIDNEVETIVLKCLAKERARRYQTAGELARDLRRYLADEPIEAKRDSAGYVLRKHLRRHKLALAVFAGFVIVVTVGFVTSLTFWRQAADERDAAKLARDNETEQRLLAESSAEKAEREASKTQAVLDFLTDDLLAAADPKNTENRQITVKEALDLAAEHVGEEFEQEPLIEAEIRMTLGTTYRSLGEYEAAEPHLVRALELRRTTLGESTDPAFSSLNHLGLLRLRQGRYDEAERLFNESYEGRLQLLGEEHLKTLSTLANLAQVHLILRRFDEAEPLAIRVLETRRRVLGSVHPETLTAMNNLAALYRSQKRYAEAEPLFVEALETRRRISGSAHPRTLSILNNLGLLHLDQGRHAEAEPLLLESLESSRRVFGDDHPDTLRSAFNLAGMYQKQKRHAAAEPLLVQCLDGYRRVLGDDHPNTARCAAVLAQLFHELERYDEAAPLYEAAVDTRRRKLGPDHPHTLMSMHNLATLNYDRGDFEESERVFREAYEVQHERLGDSYIGTILSLRGLTRSLVKLERFEEAEPLGLRYYELAQAADKPIRGGLSAAAAVLADLYDAWGRPESAAEWRERANASP